MCALLAKFLTHYDPLLFGQHAAGVASGSIMQAGVAGWGDPQGRSILYHGTSRSLIDNPVGAAPRGSETIQPWAAVSLQASTTHWFCLIPHGPGGVAAVADTPAIAKVATDGDGDSVAVVPAPVRTLQVRPIVGGEFLLAWSYQPAARHATAAKFNVYHDNGTCTVDTVTPVATVTARLGMSGRGGYLWTSGEFAHGTAVKYLIRAATSDDAEEQNNQVVSATADAQGPSGTAVTDHSYGGDE